MAVDPPSGASSRSNPLLNRSGPKPAAERQNTLLAGPSSNPHLNRVNALLAPSNAPAPKGTQEPVLAGRIVSLTPQGTLQSRELYAEKCKEALSASFLADVEKCVVAFGKEWKANSDKFQKDLEVSLEKYLQAFGQVAEQFTKFAFTEIERILQGGGVEQGQVDRGEWLLWLVKKTREVYLEDVQRLQTLCIEQNNLIKSKYSAWLFFLYEERFKYLDLATKALTEARSQEEHEMNQYVLLHSQELLTNQQEFNQVVEAIKVKLLEDKQVHDMQMQEASHALEREKLKNAIRVAQQQVAIERAAERNRHAEAVEKTEMERELGLRKLRIHAALENKKENNRHSEAVQRAEGDRDVALKRITAQSKSDARREANRHEEALTREENQRVLGLNRANTDRMKVQYESYLQGMSLQLGYEALQMDGRLRLARMCLLGN